MKFAIFFILQIWFLSCSWAKTLVVSDIDDTIKVSHVRSFWQSLANSGKAGPAFRGMVEIYNELVEQNDLDLVYVTNAPALLMSLSHNYFIQYNGFPQRPIYFWSTGAQAEHKFDTISTLLESQDYDSAILIGDNGEKDPMIYAKIRQRYPHLPIKIYIRTLYGDGTPLAVPAKGFMHPGELSISLCRSGLLDVQRERNFRRQMNSEIKYKIETENQVFEQEWTIKVPLIKESPCK